MSSRTPDDPSAPQRRPLLAYGGGASDEGDPYETVFILQPDDPEYEDAYQRALRRYERDGEPMPYAPKGRTTAARNTAP